MTSRRLQCGSLVKERKKYEARLGKIVSEAAVKTWSVRFFPDNEPEERKSAQLSVIEQSEVPPEVLQWLNTGKLDVPVPKDPPSSSPNEKENPTHSLTSPGGRATPKSPIEFPSPDDPLGFQSPGVSSAAGFLSPGSTPRPPTSERTEGSDDETTTTRNDILLTTRRKSVYGRSVQKRNTNSTKSKPRQRRVQLFPVDTSDSDSDDQSYNPDDYDPQNEMEPDDEEEEEDMVMTAERLLAFDEQLADLEHGKQTLDTDDMVTQQKTLTHFRMVAKANEEKKALIGEEVIVINKGSNKKKVKSKWRVIEDISDAKDITAKKRAQNEIGVIDLDFNRLPEANYPLAEVFFRFWPGNAMDQLSKLNIEFRKQYPKKPPVTLKEFFGFFACLLAATPAGYGGDKLWYPPTVKGIFPHPDLNKVMPRNRFKAIKSSYVAAFACDWTHVVKEGETWSPFEHETPETDPWAKIQGLVNDFNTTVKRNFSASNDICLDESMSPFKPRQSKKANLPHLTFVFRKPEPYGTEYKTAACAESGVMLKLEIQRGEKGMQDIRHSKKLGATAACTVRLGEDTVSSNSSHCDTLYGDAWFASVRTATAVDKLLGCHFVGHIKQSHRRFPKEWMHKVMDGWPGGTHLVLESCFGDSNLIAVGYKYNKKKVCTFIMTRGALLTTQGDPYMSKFLSDFGNYKSRKIHRPLAVSTYFGVSGKIDVHNQIRQAEIALEKLWGTSDGWFRNVCTILGMAVTNAYVASSFSFASDCEYSKLKAKDFVSILAQQLASFPFPESSTFGKSVLPPGQSPPQWFELLPERFTTSTPNNNALNDVTNTIEVEESPTVGKTKLRSGWSAATQVTMVQRPPGAPGLPPDITEYHRQVKIKASENDGGKRHRPKACRMCKLHGLKQKKAPYLCVECGEFFCHDTERGRTGSVPRGCYWTHMCHIFKDSGVATPKWQSDFEKWNEDRISRCKQSDGLL